jgi:hypothetical protein
MGIESPLAAIGSSDALTLRHRSFSGQNDCRQGIFGFSMCAADLGRPQRYIAFGLH